MSEQILSPQYTVYAFFGLIVLMVAAYVLLSRVGWRRGGAGAVPATNADMREVIRRLRMDDAQWPTIVAELNPKNDPKVSQLLQELRGPHMFVPHTALNIIETACLSTLRENPRASLREVLSNARASMEGVTKYGG